MTVEFKPEISPDAEPMCHQWPTAASGAATFFFPSEAPASVANRNGDRKLVLGTRFTAMGAGVITGFRFFQSQGEVGRSHMGWIYDASTGKALAAVKIAETDCSRPGWISVALPAPVTTIANTEYIVAIENVIYYPKSEQYFSTTLKRGKLQFTGGVYGFVSNRMPSENAGAANYWLDGQWP
jgi:hypothetical protein